MNKNRVWEKLGRWLRRAEIGSTRPSSVQDKPLLEVHEDLGPLGAARRSGVVDGMAVDELQPEEFMREWSRYTAKSTDAEVEDASPDRRLPHYDRRAPQTDRRAQDRRKNSGR